MSAPRSLDLRGVPAADVDFGPIVDHVRAGGLLAYPTETVYGFGGACTPDAVGRVRALKRREASKPLLLLVASADAVSGLAWTPEARELARLFWPGAVTLVLGDPDHIFSAGVRNDAGGVAVRVSPHPLVGPLLDRLDAPLTSSSANAPGTDPARSGAEALAAAGSLGAGPDMLVLDAGTLPPSEPSTIVDCMGAQPAVVRAGSVPLHRLRCALPEIDER